MLTNLGHDVLLASDVDPRAPDEALLDLAMQEGRVLVFVEMRVDDQVAAMQELLDRYLEEMQGGALIVVTRGRIRIRY